MPYVSKEVHSVGLNLWMKSGFFARTDCQYFPKQYHDLNNTKTIYRYDALGATKKSVLTYLNYASDASGTKGIVPVYSLVNLSFGFKRPEKKRSIFLNAKNIKNKDYISTKLPEGIQPGPKRQINIGFSMEL